MNLIEHIDDLLESDYMMGHRPSKTSPLHDITQGGTIPDDVYTHPQYYGSMSDKSYKQSFAAISKFRGKPNSTVTIYRASPRNMLNKGDWVTLSKAYAKQESMSEQTAVHSFKVKVKDVWFAGDDFNEFGYWGKDVPEDKDWLNNQLETEKAYIMKRGRMPDSPILMKQYRKSSHFNKYGSSEKQRSSAYYDFIWDVVAGVEKLG